MNNQLPRSGKQARQKTIPVQRLACYALLRDDASILLCRLTHHIKAEGAWTLPGGGVEFGEHPLDALRREVKEETGYEIETAGFAMINSMVYRFPGPPRHAIRLVFHAKIVGGEQKHEAEGTTDRCQWFTREETKNLQTVDLAEIGIKLAFAEN